MDIDVERLEDGSFRVEVEESGTTSTHLVTVGETQRSLLERGQSERDLIVASFRFLLEREPKESIMSRFDLSVIGRYFPEYDDKIGGYL